MAGRRHSLIDDFMAVRIRMKRVGGYADLLKAGKKDEAGVAFRGLSSAFDKAAKRGVIHKASANRKKSRLSVHLSNLK